MKVPIVEQLVAQFEREAPGAFKVFAPRRYVPPQGYFNPKYYAASATAVNGSRRKPDQSSESNLQVVSYGLAEYAVPTYFVAPAFAEAVMRTRPPEGVSVGDVKWPMPAMLFALTAETSSRLFGLVVPFVAVSRLAPGENHPPAVVARHFPEARKITYGPPEGGVAVHALALFGYGTASPEPVDYSFAASSRKLLSEVCTDSVLADDYWTDEFTRVINAKYGIGAGDDVRVLNAISTFVFGVVLVLAARPALVEDPSGVGRLQRPERVSRGRVEKEALWAPNVVGFKYRVARPPGDGTHASPRLHWRRGHFRNQPVGPGRTERKVLWIEPFLVNAGGAE